MLGVCPPDQTCAKGSVLYLTSVLKFSGNNWIKMASEMHWSVPNVDYKVYQFDFHYY